MINVNQDHQLQWRVILEDGEAITWPRFHVAWAYSMPDAGHGWTYLAKADAVQRFLDGEQKIRVAWKQNKEIYLEYF